MPANLPQHIAFLLSKIEGTRCWYASSGGCVGSSFQLALGDKIPRPGMLANNTQTDEYRRYEGEIGILVWCAWRLDRLNGSATSWDSDEPTIENGLKPLVGSRIEKIDVDVNSWDAIIKLFDGLTLNIFCDHISTESSFDGNWELWVRDTLCAFGPGSANKIEMQKSQLSELSPVIGERGGVSPLFLSLKWPISETGGLRPPARQTPTCLNTSSDPR